MTVAVRSTQLFARTISTTGITGVYTGPDGWRTILKSIQWDYYGSVAANLVVYIGSVAKATQVAIFRGQIQNGTGSSYSSWVVLNPTDYIWFSTDQATLHVWGSGTLLQITGGEPPVSASLPAPGVGVPYVA